jgi:magnesium-transporting ATPase (P-type)
METAINIGYSCKVLREGMFLLQLACGSAESVEHGLCQLYQTVMDKRPTPWTLMETLQGKPNPQHQAVMDMMAKHFPSGSSSSSASGGGGGGAAASQDATAKGGQQQQGGQGQGVPGGDGVGPQSSSSSSAPLASVAPPPATPSTNGSSTAPSSTSTPHHAPPPLLSRRSSRAIAVPSSPTSLFRALENAMVSPSKAMRGVESSSGGTPYAFIMEGPALVHVLGNRVLETMLFDVMQRSVAVIACRVSPKQKALLVRLVKQNVKVGRLMTIIIIIIIIMQHV